jgi:hypothetical protein
VNIVDELLLFGLGVWFDVFNGNCGGTTFYIIITAISKFYCGVYYVDRGKQVL